MAMTNNAQLEVIIHYLQLEHTFSLQNCFDVDTFLIKMFYTETFSTSLIIFSKVSTQNSSGRSTFSITFLTLVK